MVKLNETPSDDPTLEVQGDIGELQYERFSSWAGDGDYQRLIETQNINDNFEYSFDSQQNFDYSFDT